MRLRLRQWETLRRTALQAFETFFFEQTFSILMSALVQRTCPILSAFSGAAKINKMQMVTSELFKMRLAGRMTIYSLIPA